MNVPRPCIGLIEYSVVCLKVSFALQNSAESFTTVPLISNPVVFTATLKWYTHEYVHHLLCVLQLCPALIINISKDTIYVRKPVLRIRNILMRILILLLTVIRIRIRTLPFTLRRIRILPLTFFKILTLQCSNMTLYRLPPFTLMRTRIRIMLFTFMRIRFRIQFPLWCGTGSGSRSSFPKWCGSMWIRIHNTIGNSVFPAHFHFHSSSMLH